MRRTLWCCLSGIPLGGLCGCTLLWLIWWIRTFQTVPKQFAVENDVIYLGVILAAGFGGVCGAVIGLASCVEEKKARSSQKQQESS